MGKKTSRKTKVCQCDTLAEAEKPTKCSCRGNELGWRAPKGICQIPAFGRFPQRSGTPALNNEHYSTASSNAALFLAYVGARAVGERTRGAVPPRHQGSHCKLRLVIQCHILLNINVRLCPHVYSGEGSLSHRPRRVRADH